jgi:hypothetical protein
MPRLVGQDGDSVSHWVTVTPGGDVIAKDDV